jgi:outer membrane immunogenic protein
MRGIAVVCALVSAIGVARAADLPMGVPPAPPPVAVAYNWSGFYLGGNLGATFANLSEVATITGGPFAGTTLPNNSSGSAIVAGVQGGYNWQADRAVFGIEADFDFSGLTAKSPTSATTSVKTTWPALSTVRGRIGAAFDRLLIYGTGGVAFNDMQTKITAPGLGTVYNASQFNTGWTVGVGIDYAYAPNWIVRAEYLYVDTDLSLSGALTGSGGTLTYTGPLKQNVIRTGFNYKF